MVYPASKIPPSLCELFTTCSKMLIDFEPLFQDDATYLHIAASNGNEAITECLLDHGARIDLRNKVGFIFEF